MLCSQTSDKIFSKQQIKQLKTILGSDTLNLVKTLSGGNSKVFCVEANNQLFALKSYPKFQSEQRDRLASEVEVYKFLTQNHINSIPQLRHVCSEERWIILDWIEGELPKSYTSLDIIQALQFIQNIAHISLKPEAQLLPKAAEACVSLQIILFQIQNRLTRLSSITDDSILQRFLQQQFIPIFEKISQFALSGYYQAKINPDKPIDQKQCTLVPSDFGFHNAIRDQEGQLYFFDFDYFGWDDPVKLLSDILWHPKMQLSESQERQFIDGLAHIYHHPDFLIRFQYCFPLFGLRWVLIILNEFIPEYWQNRQYAGELADHKVAKQRQLHLAESFLNKIHTHGSQICMH